ncbi:cellulase family glycosylhydrolase [Gelidibacter pelagius]|uniref:Cellulase family glycosylhydrolase n=1 Tax=Gelidibacter pelagius TaxID=2819985 RepID=A0ABS3STZ3_9FLAO|nr:cellulase family glycosylhydrolase [Gelidibacter pelagius]MBO3098363.1 cellulase family glycosylhydrolase [Gelidibacter pelagius]
MIKFQKGLVLLLIAALFLSCENNKEKTVKNDALPNTITVQGDRFVDDLGRQVILNGVNVGSKNKEEGYIFQSGPELYANLKKHGVNTIRFLIIWDGLEPEPGVYNEEYLKEIDQRIQWAADNNIFVVLDMHQDLYSVKYSDGAPEWATLDEGKPHTTGAIWSDAYLLSEAVQTSFDNFWLNKPAADGVGIQDRYIALWQHIAKRYANNKTVIGYDLMNEPFPGSSGVQSTMILLGAYGQLHYKLTGEVLTEEQLGAMWSEEESRMEALEVISTKENYDFVISQLFDLVKEFESKHLQEMYQKVSNAIREVDSNHIIFLEHSYYGNTGVASSIERVSLTDGSPDPLVAYAAHGYDLVVDTKAAALAADARVGYIFNQIKKKGEQLKMPVWVGEWGAYYDNSETVIPTAISTVSLIEDYLFGNAYWSYTNDLEDMEYFKKILVRAYPAYTNGELLSYNNDFEANTFTMEWEESNDNSPTVVYIPHLSKLNEEAIKDFTVDKIADSDAGYLIIPATEAGTKRKLSLIFE